MKTSHRSPFVQWLIVTVGLIAVGYILYWLYSRYGHRIHIFPAKDTHSWWGPMFPALTGTVQGIFFGIWGTWASITAERQKNSAPVHRLLKAMMSVGAIQVALSILAFANIGGDVAGRQPFYVWFPLLLTGGILLGVGWLNLFFLNREDRKKTIEQELLKMKAMDS